MALLVAIDRDVHASRLPPLPFISTMGMLFWGCFASVHAFTLSTGLLHAGCAGGTEYVFSP